jgi:hypothetical protein
MWSSRREAKIECTWSEKMMLTNFMHLDLDLDLNLEAFLRVAMPSLR